MFFTIPCIPPKVDLKDLQANGLLVSETEKAEMLQVTEAGRISKRSEEHHLTRSLIVTAEGQHFAVYRGANQGKALGQGGYGVVKLAQHLETGEWVALKISQDDLKNTLAETEMLKKATGFGTHLYLQHSLGIKKKPKINLLMKLAGGLSLEKIIDDKMQLSMSPHEIVNMAVNVCSSFEELHKKGITHRDIKPANVVIDPASNHASVVDFGFAGVAAYDFDSIAGTAGYIAPEITSTRNPALYGKKSDTYALGVTLAELFGMEIEYSKVSDKERYKKAVTAIKDSTACKYLIPDESARRYLVKLVNDMTNSNPNERLGLEDAHRKLRKIYSSMGYSRQQDLTVGALDVSEYNQMSAEERKNLLTCLKQFDQVVVVDRENSQITPFDIAKFHHLITDKGVACINQAYHYTNKETLLSDLQKKMGQDNNYQNYHVCYISRDSQPKDINPDAVIQVAQSKSKNDYQASIDGSYKLNKVSDGDLFKIKNQLAAEVGRINKKYAEKKPKYAKKITDLLNEAVADITGPERKNYNQMHDRLDKLEKDIGNIKKSSIIPKMFQGEKHAQKKIRKTIVEATAHSERRRPG